jgi:secreted trypsin-like serine protease
MKISILCILTLATCTIAAQNSQEQRIIGGDVAFAGQIPYIAAIYKRTNEGTFFCGGALMNDQWILTSGHCVYEAVLFTIYLGTTNIQKLDSTGLQLATDTYILHPDFNPDTLENDIGLIKLRIPITFTDYIKPVNNLPSYELLPNTGGLMSMGWGQTSDETAGLEEELNFVYLIPISNEECRLTYGNQIKDSMVCVGGNFNEGFCQGDNGSPLVRYTNGPRTTHMGIASFISANGCDTPEPSGYTRTYHYVDWIRNVTDII